MVKACADCGNGLSEPARAYDEAGAGKLHSEPGAQSFRHGGETEDKAVPHAGGGIAADERSVRVDFKGNAGKLGRARGK